MVNPKFMNVNVILSFATLNKCGDSQEYFDIKLPINEIEIDSVDFVHTKLFSRIEKKCHFFGRDPRDLIKISAACDWDLFEQYTGQSALCNLGHPCKWYFGLGRDDLDNWEKELMQTHGFGTNADMSDLDEFIRRLDIAAISNISA
jgi:hypothetical protein